MVRLQEERQQCKVCRVSGVKTAFISYSWDSEDHKVWVRELAERLVLNGVHVHLDQWDVQFGDSLTHFMDTKLPAADFVLVICTPSYAQKAAGRLGGAGYEAQIITSRIASGFPRTKFVPILRAGSMKLDEADCAIPPHFQGVYALDARTFKSFEPVFENLLRHIYDQPSLKRPALGPPPIFDASSQLLQRADRVRLASLEIEKWALSSGVVMNELHPSTFHIPDEASRRGLEFADIVKLSFGYAYDEEPEDGLAGERMWVRVTASDGPYFIGTLANCPIGTEEYHHLEFGSQIVFLPEHVISVDKGGRDSEEARAQELEYSAIIQGIFRDFGIEEGNDDEVKMLVAGLEREHHFDPEKDIEELWHDVSNRIKYAESSKEVAWSLWTAMLEDDDDDEEAEATVG